MILYKTKQAEIIRLDNISSSNTGNTENTGGTGENIENSKKYADLAQSYAIGTGNSIRENDMSDNSKYYWELVRDAIDNGQLAGFEYFQTYDEFEEALRNDNIRDDIIVIIKDHVYSSDDNNDIIDNTLSFESRRAVQNKVVTKALNDLNAKIPQTDARLSSTSENPIQNKAIHAEIQELKREIIGFSRITVDNELSSTSENPVQNKVIYSKLEEISNKINNLSTKLEEVSNKITNSGSNTGSSGTTGNTIESKYALLAGWEFTSNGNLTNGQSSLHGTNKQNLLLSDGELIILTNNQDMFIQSGKNLDIISDNIGIYSQLNDKNIYIGRTTDGKFGGDNNIYLIGKVYVNGKLLE